MSITAVRTKTTTTPKPLDFNDLYHRYYQRLYERVLSMTRNREKAEDVTATAFAKAFAHRESFRGEASPYTWLHAIAVNEILARRQDWRIAQVDISTLENLAEPPSRELEQAETSKRLTAALHQVPAFYRRVLIDRYIDGRSVRQMARLNSVPLGTVLSRLFKAKQFLREAWES